MRPRHFTSDINSHGDGEPPPEGDVRESAVNHLAGIVRWEQHDHCDYPNTKHYEHERAEELSDQLGRQCGLRVHSCLREVRSAGVLRPVARALREASASA